MRPKTYVVTGTSGHVGRAAVESLHARGHRTREVGRRAGVSIDDAEAVKRAFSQADGAFVIIPFDVKARDLHEREMGMKLADAVRARTRPRRRWSTGLETRSAMTTSMREDDKDRVSTVGIRATDRAGCRFRAGRSTIERAEGGARPRPVDSLRELEAACGV
jgi:NAD(P)-dependent dehydrogenase (short-subunit alcohol dehydrogenase family)